MGSSKSKMSRKETAQLCDDRKKALNTLLKTIRRNVKIGIDCRESFVGIVNFSRQSKLFLSLYKLGTSISREATAKYVFDTTGDIMEPERLSGNQYQFLKDRCFAIRVIPSDPTRSTPQHRFVPVGWKDEVSYNTADHHMTIRLDVEEPLSAKEKTRLFGPKGIVFRP